MCCVCRERFQKHELIRIARTETGAKPDLEYKLEGRGVYICKNAECIKGAQKRKSLQRGLKSEVGEGLYSQLTAFINSGE